VAGLLSLFPTALWACACGCGIFDVGAGTLMPTDAQSGLSAWFRYAYMDQNQNWEGSSKALAADNADKKISTNFYFVGAQYSVSPSWMVMAEQPVFSRSLTTTDDGTVAGPAGSVYTGRIADLGDLQVSALYTGFAEDNSTGISFGFKLPTGNYTGPTGPLGGAEFDRDSLPGTGSTDVMFGGYHVGALNAAGSLLYFVQARYQIAFLDRDDYRPGNELDGAVGVTYDFGEQGPLSKIAPILQLIGSDRARDSGANADPLNSGYRRLLVAPGLELRFNQLRLYADIELPIYQNTNAASSLAIEGTAGQLVASKLLKMQVAYDF
jgi:hypothetical protein